MPSARTYFLLAALLIGCESRSAPVPRATNAPAASAAQKAGAIRTVRHAASEWVTFDLDLDAVELSLVGQRPNEPSTLPALGPYLAQRKRELVVATNAGIFSPTRRPMGLHIQNGQELAPISTADGDGNFFLKPNGVFWLDERGPHVASTENYAPRGKVELATQSGPLLVAGGRIHPAFKESSTSLRIRSGVGVDGRGHVFIVLSRERVTFHAMATLFRDVLGCPDALYLDGEISAIAAPGFPTPSIHEYGGLLVATRREMPER
ncbi:MAG: phosphodiester glycosidase family protein [Polyangiaceae bacterium]|nr:phosphodiester glycosidase family protein [Polyangiaceae bacterium]